MKHNEFLECSLRFGIGFLLERPLFLLNDGVPSLHREIRCTLKIML